MGLKDENVRLLKAALDTAQHRRKRRGRTGKVDPGTGLLNVNPSVGLPSNKIWVRVGATTRDDPGRELRAVWNFSTTPLYADVAVQIDVNADGEWEITGLDTTIANREYGAAAPTFAMPAVPDELNQTLITANRYTPDDPADWPGGEPVTKDEALDVLAETAAAHDRRFSVRIVTFVIGGELAVGTGGVQVENRLSDTATITGVYLRVGTAPVGEDIVVDVNRNGSTIFTTQANRPRITAGNTVGHTTTIDAAQWPVGDALSVDLDTVGDSVKGSDLVVEVVVTA